MFVCVSSLFSYLKIQYNTSKNNSSSLKQSPTWAPRQQQQYQQVIHVDGLSEPVCMSSCLYALCSDHYMSVNICKQEEVELYWNIFVFVIFSFKEDIYTSLDCNCVKLMIFHSFIICTLLNNNCSKVDGDQ